MFEVFCYEQDSSRVSIDGSEFFSVPEEAPLMQFTGCYHGTEIYERDILTSVGDSKVILVEDLRDLGLTEAAAAEVIGNVHETPWP